MRRVWVGCSGWNYPHWRGAIYPKGLPARRWLGHYATLFGTVGGSDTGQGCRRTRLRCNSLCLIDVCPLIHVCVGSYHRVAWITAWHSSLGRERRIVAGIAVVEGSGEPVLVLHGWAWDSSIWNDARPLTDTNRFTYAYYDFPGLWEQLRE